MNSSSPDQWLIRTSTNRISRPLTRQQVCELIEKGQLHSNDEVCHANHYWFYLNEHEEIKNQLGIQMTKELFRGAEEETETATEFELEDTDPELGTTLHKASLDRNQEYVFDRNDEIPDSEAPDITRIASMGVATSKSAATVKPEIGAQKSPLTPQRQGVQRPAQQPVQQPQAEPRVPQRRATIEKSQWMTWLAALMMVAGLIFVFKILELLGKNP